MRRRKSGPGASVSKSKSKPASIRIAPVLLGLILGAIILATGIGVVLSYLGARAAIDLETDRSFDQGRRLAQLVLESHLNALARNLDHMAEEPAVMTLLSGRQTEAHAAGPGPEGLLPAGGGAGGPAGGADGSVRLEGEGPSSYGPSSYGLKASLTASRGQLELLLLVSETGEIRVDASSPLVAFGDLKQSVHRRLVSNEGWHLIPGRAGSAPEARLLALAVSRRPVIQPSTGRVLGWLVGGIALHDNFALANAMQEAVGMAGLALAKDKEILVRSQGGAMGWALSEDRGETGEPAPMEALQPCLLRALQRPFATVETPEGVLLQARALLLGGRDVGLMLVGAMPDRAFSELRQIFSRNGLLLLVVAGVAAGGVTLALRGLILRSLGHLVGYANSLGDATTPPAFQPGRIMEFNRVGEALARMLGQSRSNELYLDNLFRAVQAPILVWGPDERVSKVNEATALLFDRPSPALIGVSIKEMCAFLVRDQERVCDHLDRALRGETIKGLETTLRLPRRPGDEGSSLPLAPAAASSPAAAAAAAPAPPSASASVPASAGGSESVADRTLVWTIAPVQDCHGQVVAVIAQGLDITERKQAEQALAEKTAELERSNAELEQFAYIASHDLQEPLRTVVAYNQMILRRYRDKLDADANDFLGYSIDGAMRMQRLIIDLLDYSRATRKTAPFAPVALGEVMEQIRADLEAALKAEGGRIDWHDLPVVWGDGAQIRRLLLNLVGNGLKYRSAARLPLVAVTAEPNPTGWTVTVTDNGIGIPPEQYERVFRIFQRLHGRDEYSGTGIGLAVCRRIVEHHGGRIWIEPGPEEGGSRFLFTLPATPVAAFPPMRGAAS